jgi:hypothetical protein
LSWPALIGSKRWHFQEGARQHKSGAPPPFRVLSTSKHRRVEIRRYLDGTVREIDTCTGKPVEGQHG